MPFVADLPDNPSFVLQHGWGLSDRCWQQWAPALPRLWLANRGYWGEPTAFDDLPSGRATVLVCHSLGLHLLPQQWIEQAKALVIISGFAHFHGESSGDGRFSRRHLSAMLNRIESDHLGLLDDFYRDCQCPPALRDQRCLNQALLTQDLHLLDRSRLPPEGNHRFPATLILHGRDDRIVRPARAVELATLIGTPHLTLIDGAGHGLPFTHPQDCLNLIRDFLAKVLLSPGKAGGLPYGNYSRSSFQLFRTTACARKETTVQGRCCDHRPIRYCTHPHPLINNSRKSGDMNLKDTIASHFSRASASYDQYAVMQQQAALSLVRWLLDLSHELPPGPVLEVGCGTGIVSRELARMFFDRPLTLVDLAPGMIRQNRQALAPLLEPGQEVDWQVRDAETINTSGRYALIASCLTLQWFQDPIGSLVRLSEALTPGGILLCSFLGAGSFSEWQEACLALNLPCTMNQLPDCQALLSRLQAQGLEANAWEERIRQDYPNAQAFFRSLKQTGTNTHTTSGRLTLPQMSRLLSSWPGSGYHGVTITYQTNTILVRA